MGHQPLLLLPEICMLIGAVTALLAGSFLPRSRQWVAGLIASTAVISSGVTAAWSMTATSTTIYSNTYALDPATTAARLTIAAATLLVLALAAREVKGDVRESETYALLLLAALGSMLLAGASDLLVLAVAFLLASIPLYALVGIRRTPAAAEAAMKTYLLGALLGIFMLLGTVLLVSVAGASTYRVLGPSLTDAPYQVVAIGVVGVLAGLLFKAGGAPAHFWVPDAAQAAGVSAAAFVTTVPKIGALIAMYRLVEATPDSVDVRLLVALIAAASMTIGNLSALLQQDPRRLLGWSTVSQVGYLLLPVAVAGRSEAALPSLLLYLAAYSATNLTAFAVVAALPDRRRLPDYRGLLRHQPWLCVALVVALLSFVGTPPTGVFIGKLTTFTAAWDGGLRWLVVVAAINTLISLAYYLRWIGEAAGVAPIDDEDNRPETAFASARRSAALVAVASMTLVLALGVAAQGIWPMLEGPLIR